MKGKDKNMTNQKIQRQTKEGRLVSLAKNNPATIAEDAINFQDYFTTLLDMLDSSLLHDAEADEWKIFLSTQFEMFKIASKYRKMDNVYRIYAEKLEYMQSLINRTQ